MHKKTLTRWRLELVLLLLVAMLPVSLLAVYALPGHVLSGWAWPGLFLLTLAAGLALAFALAERLFIAPFNAEVDQLKQTVAELERNQRILHIAGRVARLGGWTIELPGRKLTWSDENCRIHDVPPGYLPTLDEGIGYFFPEDRATVIHLVDACVQHGTPYEFVLPKLTAKGRRIWVRSIGEAVREEDGKIIRIQGAFQDITVQKEAEARTLADQSQLRLLEMAISRLNDMVVITEAEPKGRSGPQIVFVNDAFERYTGYSREEAIGKTPRFLWGAATQPATLERIATAIANWQAIRTEVAITTKSGTEVWLEIDIAPMADESGKITHWVGVERDITDRRQQQQEILNLNSELESRVLLRTSQLASVNKELESFAYSVSHDLRSPLNTIDGFSRLLVKHDGERVSERGRHYLDRIHASVKQMGHLIDGLLVLAHLSREEIVYENIDLSAMARQIASQCREREPERELHIHIHEGLATMGDSRLVFAVVQNLLSNAWKFSSKREVTHIEVGSQPDENDGSIFYVKDNGAGFDMVFAPKLFGTFERLHSPGDFPGTGIGLATVRRVIERHGGRVWAEAVPDEGATFYFTLGRPADANLVA